MLFILRVCFLSKSHNGWWKFTPDLHFCLAFPLKFSHMLQIKIGEYVYYNHLVLISRSHRFFLCNGNLCCKHRVTKCPHSWKLFSWNMHKSLIKICMNISPRPNIIMGRQHLPWGLLQIVLGILLEIFIDRTKNQLFKHAGRVYEIKSKYFYTHFAFFSL